MEIVRMESVNRYVSNMAEETAKDILRSIFTSAVQDKARDLYEEVQYHMIEAETIG